MRNEPPKNNRLKTSYVLIYLPSLSSEGGSPPCNTSASAEDYSIPKVIQQSVFQLSQTQKANEPALQIINLLLFTPYMNHSHPNSNITQKDAILLILHGAIPVSIHRKDRIALWLNAHESFALPKGYPVTPKTVKSQKNGVKNGVCV